MLFRRHTLPVVRLHMYMKNTTSRTAPSPGWLFSLILSLTLLSACTSGTPPSPKAVQAAKSCAPANQTKQASPLHTGTPSTKTVPAAQGEWPMFRGNVKRDGSSNALGKEQLLQAWSYCTRAPILSSPVVHDGTVYIASTDETLTALDIPTGRVRWQIQADSPFYSTPTIQDDVLYAAALGTLYAIETRSGFVRWQMPLEIPGARFWSSPIVVTGEVIIGIASNLNEQPKIPGQVRAFDTRTGKLRWRTWAQSTGAPGAGVWSSPAVDLAKGALYVATGDPDDGVLALDLHDGHVLWHWRSVTRDTADTDIGAGPLLYSDSRGQTRVAVGSKNGLIYSLDANTGHVIWQTRVGDQVYSSPALANGILYAVGVHSKSAVSWGLDAQTGKPRWQHSIPALVYASPTVVGHTLYLTVGKGFDPGDGGIEVLNALNGQRQQAISLQSTATSSVAVITSWLFFGAHDGNLYAFTRQ